MVQKFEFFKTDVDGLLEINAFNAADVRGCFTKDYSKEIFEQNGVNHDLMEVFYTNSHKGVIRALHFQRVKQQAKLIRCIHGHIWDVAVDLRKDSKTFKKWVAFDLCSDEYKEVLIPAGFAHGFLALEDSVVSYKCSEKFYIEYDDGIMWNDPTINVEWPLEKIGGLDKVILAEKDKNHQSFEEFIQKYGGL